MSERAAPGDEFVAPVKFRSSVLEIAFLQLDSALHYATIQKYGRGPYTPFMCWNRPKFGPGSLGFEERRFAAAAKFPHGRLDCYIEEGI